MEPKPSTQYQTRTDAPAEKRNVPVVLSLEWAQAVTRLQQLHNEGCTVVRLCQDEHGRMRIEPND